MGQAAEQWIPLMEYAMKKGVSLSTLRRQIKSNKIPFRLENGRYLVLENGVIQQDAVAALVLPQSSLAPLQLELIQAREEIAELKMLIACYEESLFKPRMDV